MQYIVFGAVWVGLILLVFVTVGAFGSENYKIISRREDDPNPPASLGGQYETNAILAGIALLLAGILAVLVATQFR